VTDRFVSDLRAQLMAGAVRRRRWERGRLGALVALPLVAAVVAAVVVSARDDGDGAGVVSAGVVTPEAATACDAVNDWWNGSNVLYAEGYANAVRTFAEAAQASGDDGLAALGRRAAGARPGQFDGVPISDVMRDATSRCLAIGAPGYVPTYVAAPLGPEPTVPLARYGTEVPFGPVVEVPPGLAEAARGRDVVRVEAAVTPLGGYVAHWTATDIRRQPVECRRAGDDTAAGGGCAPLGTRAAGPPPGVEVLATGGSEGHVVLATAPDVAFVVVRAGDAALVQRPALQTIVLPAPPHAAGVEVVVEAYDAAGGRLACTVQAGLSPVVPGRSC
jgi:hypothetical protein